MNQPTQINPMRTISNRSYVNVAKVKSTSKELATLLFLTVPTLFIFLGCETVRHTGTRKVPAEVNMAGRDRVVLQTIQGQGGQVITSRLKPALAAADFKVLDRQSLGTRVREEELRDLGVADEQERQKIMSAGVLIRGNVVRHAFDRGIQEAQQTGERNGVKYTYTVYRDVGRATVEVGFDVIDLGTTEIIAPKTVTAIKAAQTEWSTSPPRVSPEPIFNQCYDEVVRQFMKAISAHDVHFDVTLYKNSKLPDNEAGVGMFLAKDYAQAAKHFEAALESAKTLPKMTPDKVSKVWHNLGLAYEFGHNYDKALDSYKQAIALKPTPTYQQSVARCTKRMNDAGRLREQGQSVTSS